MPRFIRHRFLPGKQSKDCPSNFRGHRMHRYFKYLSSGFQREYPKRQPEPEWIITFGQRTGRVLEKFSPKPTNSATGRSSWAFCRGTLSGKSRLNASCALLFWSVQSLKQAIRTGFKVLRQPSEYDQRDWVRATLNVADCFPMHANQFSQALLGHVCFKPSFTDMLAKHPQDLLIGHSS